MSDEQDNPQTFTIRAVQEAFSFGHGMINGTATPAEILCAVEMALGLSDAQLEGINHEQGRD